MQAVSLSTVSFGEAVLSDFSKLDSFPTALVAKTFSLVHQRDVARAVDLALTGAMDGRIVNIVDDAPTTLYEMASLVGSPIEPSAEPLADPWMGRMDGSLSRRLGFHPTVRTVYQAAQQGIL